VFICGACADNDPASPKENSAVKSISRIRKYAP